MVEIISFIFSLMFWLSSFIAITWIVIEVIRIVKLKVVKKKSEY